MEPVKGGSLVNVPEPVERMFRSYAPDMSVASWAIRFAASLENVVMVLSGMSNDEQVADNIGYMKDFEPLSDEQMRIVMTAAELIRNNITVPCTDCRYCMDDCPKRINIPGCFSVYNSMKRGDKKDGYDAAAEYENATRGRGRAGDCIKCGRCEKHCPQTIPVIKFLEDISKELD